MLVLFIISASVVVTLHFKPLYYLDMKLLDIPEMSGISEEDIRLNYDVLIDYNSIFGPDTLDFPTLAMSDTGRIHFEEVKEVFLFFEYTAIVTGIISVVGIIARRFLRIKGEYLLTAGVLTVAIPSVVGILIAINWERVFILFHEIVFNNDYWIFSPVTDPVITILPDRFFMHCALMIAGLVMVGAAVCILCHRIGKKTKIKEKEAIKV